MKPTTNEPRTGGACLTQHLKRNMEPEESAETRLLCALDLEIQEAYDHQWRLKREVEILQAKSETVGEYRCKLMRLRDDLIAHNARSAGAENNQPNETDGNSPK